MHSTLNKIWQIIRRLSGDDAYERYLKNYAHYHHQETHQSDASSHCAGPLSKAAFFKQWQDEKWNGIKRCC